MARSSEGRPTGKHNRAAFSCDDVEDAKRGHPDFDLRDYARIRALEWIDHTTPAGYRAAVPGQDELQSNVLRGTLPGGEYGVLAHEGLEIPFTAEDLDWGGTFYSLRVRAGRVGLKGMLPFSGRTNEATVRVPCTVVGVRLPETAGTQTCMRIDTRRSSPPFSFIHRVKLDQLIGETGWSIWGDPQVESDVLARIAAEPVAGLLRAHAADGLFQIVAWWGTLVVRRNGFLRTFEELDELAEAASLLAERLREVCRALAEPQPLDARLPPPVWHRPGDPAAVFNPERTWGKWATATAAHYGLELEDPPSYHRAFPSVPIPGQARLVFRGAIPHVGEGRFAVHRECDASRAAVLVQVPPGSEPTPPGGVALRERGVRVEVRDDMLAVWSTTSYWGNAMAGDLDAFFASAGAAIEHTLGAAA